MSKKRATDDRTLYGENFFTEKRSSALMEAAKALYGRLNWHKEDSFAFEDLDVDAVDHYYIAARHAVRAFYREAEREMRP